MKKITGLLAFLIILILANPVFCQIVSGKIERKVFSDGTIGITIELISDTPIMNVFRVLFPAKKDLLKDLLQKRIYFEFNAGGTAQIEVESINDTSKVYFPSLRSVSQEWYGFFARVKVQEKGKTLTSIRFRPELLRDLRDKGVESFSISIFHTWPNGVVKEMEKMVSLRDLMEESGLVPDKKAPDMKPPGSGTNAQRGV